MTKTNTDNIHRGYQSKNAKGSVKQPIYMASTFTFENSTEAEDCFKAEFANPDGNGDNTFCEKLNYTYTRIDHPNQRTAEQRLALMDQAEKSLFFCSGMAAISTTLLALTKEGSVIEHTSPFYGGTDHLFNKILKEKGVSCKPFKAGSLPEINGADIIYVESPSNPTITMTDIKQIAQEIEKLPEESRPILIVDNTFLGPLFQKPLVNGADIVLYSATKFISGHSDVTAGAASGKSKLLSKVNEYRSILGTFLSPFDSWLVTRSMETFTLRMREHEKNSIIVAHSLLNNENVEEVFHPKFSSVQQKKIYLKNAMGYGGMLSFKIKGGINEAQKFLDKLSIFKIGISLGGTESLANHPATMTHCGVESQVRSEYGVTDNLIRLSIGLEDAEDLVRDLEFALK